MDFLFLNNERRRLLEDEDCRKNSRVNKKKKIVTSREIKKLDFIFTKKMNVRITGFMAYTSTTRRRVQYP